MSFRACKFKAFVHIVVVFAIFMMGISPACKFISGEAYAMEICKADGTVVVMVMNEDGTLTEKEKPGQHLETDCAFCFSNSHLKTLSAVHFKPPHPALSGQKGLLIESAVIASQSGLYLYAARGPPTLIS